MPKHPINPMSTPPSKVQHIHPITPLSPTDDVISDHHHDDGEVVDNDDNDDGNDNNDGNNNNDYTNNQQSLSHNIIQTIIGPICTKCNTKIVLRDNLLFTASRNTI